MTTSLGDKITNVLTGTISSVNKVFPFSKSISEPIPFKEPFMQDSIGVLIGLIGDIKGRILIAGNETSFSGLGESMFGMPIQGVMLESFAGELGNMVVGNLCTEIWATGVQIDITPPTVFVGQTKIFGFEKAYKLPIMFENIGNLNIIIMLENE
ncbi:chemotaxis protein CheX [Caldibacillus lycopersici]|uniref:Chemotaxis protein CheX n=1 Tax=Perspicuibacillus lycopersici TaxID=1325689 RepID=A0AAE3LMJ6_9BACI|nr:chemotaxis protein CheX [Perspicuibacillus lycopersici]MCU9613660.1 chemotaxis protein CheX [Perspicuibacillus lycopersici]